MCYPRFCWQVPDINSLEQRMMNLWKNQARKFLSRRQQDVRDQCQEYMTSTRLMCQCVCLSVCLSGVMVSQCLSGVGVKWLVYNDNIGRLNDIKTVLSGSYMLLLCWCFADLMFSWKYPWRPLSFQIMQMLTWHPLRLMRDREELQRERHAGKTTTLHGNILFLIEKQEYRCSCT